jgi:restriction system protein
MSWREFERRVVEAFRRRGFTVTGFGGNGKARGADLGLLKNGRRFLVHCRHWQQRQVGVTAVWDLDVAISAHAAQGGFAVTAGRFSPDAREFARNHGIQLIDGNGLEQLLGRTEAVAGEAVRAEEAAVLS